MKDNYCFTLYLRPYNLRLNDSTKQKHPIKFSRCFILKCLLKVRKSCSKSHVFLGLPVEYRSIPFCYRWCCTLLHICKNIITYSVNVWKILCVTDQVVLDSFTYEVTNWTKTIFNILMHVLLEVSALHYAARFSIIDVIRLLVQHGADVNIKGDEIFAD